MLPLKYNYRNLRVRWVGTLLTLLGVAVVTVVFCFTFALAQGIDSLFGTTGQKDAVLGMRSGASSETQSTISKAQLDKLRTLAGIRQDGKGPMISEEFLTVVNHPKKDGGKANVTVRGVSPRAFDLRPSVKSPKRIAERSEEALVGRGLLERFRDLEVGKTIKIKERTFSIVGVLEAEGQAYESELWVDVQLLRDEYKRTDWSSVLVQAESEAAARALRTTMKEDKELQLKAVDHQEYYKEQAMSGQMIKGLGSFLTIILGIGAVFGAMNTMYAAVAGRVREVATMRVLGFGSGSIGISFVIESLAISLAGGALGAAFSFVVFHDISTGTANWATFSEIAFRFRVTPGIMFTGLILAALIGLFGGLFPARRAARIPIARALREL